MTEPESNIEIAAADAGTPAEPADTSIPADAADTGTPADAANTGISAESVVEALLFSSDSPATAVKLAGWLAAGDAGDVKRHIAALNLRYEEQGAAFRIEQIAGGFQMLTLPDYNPWISKLHKSRADSRLSKAALETLAIVAYKQPVLRADIESVRGVAVGDMLVRLREMNLVKIAGRAEEIGRPMLYGTTKKFLDVFGLHSLKDLPDLDENAPGSVPTLRVAQDSELDSTDGEGAIGSDAAAADETAVAEPDGPADTDDALTDSETPIPVESADAGDSCDSVDAGDELQDI